MATKKQKEQLIDVLKFTPRTYKITMWGYGGEKVMGTVDRKIYDYFRHRRLDLSSFAWDSDYAEENNIPEDMWPFPPGSWYECDDMGHIHGVSRNAGTLQIEDENGNTVYQRSLEDISGGNDDEPEWTCDEEVWVDAQPAGTVVFIGNSNEKGTFFEADLPLKQPFDITKLTLQYDEVDGEEIVNSVIYDGEEIDNWGGNTDGKSSDFGFYIAGSQKATGKWEKYTNMDDLEYQMSEWFPKKINPVYKGLYMVKTAGKNSWTHQAKWTGSKWVSSYTDESDYDNKDFDVKIKEWQGLASDPDADVEWNPAKELDKIIDDFTFEQGVEALERAVADLGDEIGIHETGTDNPVDFPQAGWPFAGLSTATQDKNMATESKSKWWTVRTHYKKSCEQQEYFVQREGKGRIKVTDGFRFCEYTVETNDGEFPKFEFAQVPGGDGKNDSLDMNSLCGDNIESSELVEMFDGGCWGDIEFEGLTSEQEEELEELINDNGAYTLEDEGDWYLEDTEVWVWGPLEVEDEDGNVRIIIADENGNVIDFVEEDN